MNRNLCFLVFYLIGPALLTNEFLSKFNQSDYKAKLERPLVLSMDDNYMKTFNIKSFKFNRTQTLVNITFEFLVDVDKNDLLILFQAYKLSTNNDYRVFPCRYMLTFCQVIESNIFGVGDAYKKSNPDCPLRKNFRYHIGNYVFNEHKNPPFVPDGEYKFEHTWFYMEKNVAKAEFYIIVYRPILPSD